MGIDWSKLNQRSAQEKKSKEDSAPKDLGDALEELDLPGGLLGGRPPSRVGSATSTNEKKSG